MEFTKNLIRLGLTSLTLAYPIRGCSSPPETSYRVSPSDEPGKIQVESRYPGWFPPNIRIQSGFEGLNAVDRNCPVVEAVGGSRAGQWIVRLNGDQDEASKCLSLFVQENQ